MTKPISTAQIERIKVAYAMTGCYHEVARQVEVSERTARKYVKRWMAEAPGEYAKAMRDLRAAYRADAERQIAQCSEIARARFAEHHEGRGPDPRPNYLQAMVAWHKSLTQGARIDAEISGDIAGPGQVQIQVVGPDGELAPNGGPIEATAEMVACHECPECGFMVPMDGPHLCVPKADQPEGIERR